MAAQPQLSLLSPLQSLGRGQKPQTVALYMERFAGPAELEVYPGMAGNTVAHQSKWLHMVQLNFRTTPWSANHTLVCYPH